MDTLPLRKIAEMSGTRILSGDPETPVSGVGKDTRTISHGDLYVALRGENFDGNAFAAEAFSKGATAVLLDSEAEASKLPPGAAVLLAKDGLEALTQLAAAWRSRLKLKVLCITGSSGKTSTKEFAAAVLGTRYRTVKTAGNLNNHIGVPLSILSAGTADEAAVWEIGMNHPGEIEPLARLARPDCAIITNIGTAHIEFMGTREAIALEKGMLAEAVGSNGAVVLCADNDMTASIAARCRAKVVHAGLSRGDITADSICPDGPGVSFNIIASGSSQRASIPVPGDHMVQNALLAVAAGLQLGVTLENCLQGLAKTRIASGRLERRDIHGVHYLDDSYNANPDSMEAALQTLRSLPGQGHRIAVLGKMGELGDYAAEGYRRTGNAAGKLADILITVGNEAAPIAMAAREAGLGRIHEVADTASAARMLAQLAKPGDFVLVKGSRSARMETVIENLPN